MPCPYLLAYIPEVPSTETLCHCCYLFPLLLRQLVCILMQDGCPAGLVRQAKVNGQVKPAHNTMTQHSSAKHTAQTW